MMLRQGFDNFGNPIGRAFDLGGVDDERLHGERILLYGPSFVSNWSQVRQSVAERHLNVDIVAAVNRRCPLDENTLKRYSQIWFVSDEVVTLTSGQLQMLVDFVNSGKGLFLTADNEPLFADANLLTEPLVGTHFSGNKNADGILEPGVELGPGVFIEHPLTQGLNRLYEGVTICTVAPAEDLQILAQSHDGQLCMACYEHGPRRIVLDTGFTKFHDGFFMKTAGTARYLRNIAFWLAQGSRGLHYVPFTPALGDTPTINRGEESPHYQYELTQPSPVRLLVQWEGSATLQLTVQDGTGAQLGELRSDSSQLHFEAQSLQGRLIFWVRGVDVPFPNFPYSITLIESTAPPNGAQPTSTVGSAGQANRQPPCKQYASEAPALAVRAAVSASTDGISSRTWGSSQTNCLIILVDQSVATTQYIPGTRPGSDLKLAHVLATLLNSFLSELSQATETNHGSQPKVEIATLGFGGGVRALLGGHGPIASTVRADELSGRVIRREMRFAKLRKSDGSMVDTPTEFPVWIEPMASGPRTFHQALLSAKDIAAGWAADHKGDCPPLLINITTGLSADGDPVTLAATLARIGTQNGSLLLFNCHLNPMATSKLLFPTSPLQLPNDPTGTARQLFEMSSEIPTGMYRNAFEVMQVSPAPSARGLIFNSDLLTLRELLTFVIHETRRASQPTT